MVTFPNAKINLGLDVVARRPDGYHNLETVFYPIPLCDILEITPAMSIGWMIALLYYFINVLMLRQICHSSKANGKKISRIVIAIILTLTLITFIIGTAWINSFLGDIGNKSNDNNNNTNTNNGGNTNTNDAYVGEVEWISERDFFYYEDYLLLVLLFFVVHKVQLLHQLKVILHLEISFLYFLLQFQDFLLQI